MDTIQTNKEKLLNINNTFVYCEFYPCLTETDTEKPTLILIHGFLSSTFSFRKLIPLLQESYSILALDLPPFGKSGKTTKFQYSFINLAEVVVQVIQEHKIKNPILIGHSMGGQVALKAVKKYPKLFEKLILLSSSGYMKKLKPHLIYSSYLPFFPFGIKKWLERSGVEQNLLLCVSNPAIIDTEMIQGYEEPFNNKEIFRSLTRMVRDRECDLQSEELQNIKVPTLLMWGEEDRVVPVKVGMKLAEDLPKSTLLIYKHTGHLLPEEAPERIKHDILSFLGGQKTYTVTLWDHSSGL